MSEYVLGTGEHELARLSLQQEVWGEVTARFLDRAGLRRGAQVLDAGCGPGLVLAALRERAGAGGEVLGLDESARWGAEVRALAEREGWRNVRFLEGRLQELDLGRERFDFVFARWVLSFLPDTAELLARLARALKPDGVLALQDYNHEGVSLFPPSGGFRAIVRATRALYASRGGDAWIAGRLPRELRQAGLELERMEATALCGRPGSPAFRWADAFFPHHSLAMVEQGLLSPDERQRFLEEWRQRLEDPDAVFFSPLVVSLAARK